MVVKQYPSSRDESTNDEKLFELIADDLINQGYSVRPGALPIHISNSLFSYQQNLESNEYLKAGIGRREDYVKADSVRTDEICWITDQSDAGSMWINWTSKLQRFLNQRLFLGLFSFESHFAHYSPGDFYKRHYDSFRGEANRIVSLVTYLNPEWGNADSGELVLYRDDQDREGIKIAPLFGTVVIFLSEEFPHEVLPAAKDRFSIAGWFRVNSSFL